jgi:hypothetical protein
MIAIRKNAEDVQYNVMELTCDTEAEVATAPTKYAPGSVLFVIETSDVYMLNSEKVWVKIS